MYQTYSPLREDDSIRVALERVLAEPSVAHLSTSEMKNFGATLGAMLTEEGGLAGESVAVVCAAEDMDGIGSGLISAIDQNAERVTLGCFWMRDGYFSNGRATGYSHVCQEYLEKPFNRIDRLIVVAGIFYRSAPVEAIISHVCSMLAPGRIEVIGAMAIQNTLDEIARSFENLDRRLSFSMLLSAFNFSSDEEEDAVAKDLEGLTEYNTAPLGLDRWPSFLDERVKSRINTRGMDLG